MNIEYTKLDIIQRILSLQKESTIMRLDQILKEEKTDWWTELSVEEQQEIEQGIKEADKGEGTDHNQVMKRFNQWK